MKAIRVTSELSTISRNESELVVKFLHVLADPLVRVVHGLRAAQAVVGAVVEIAFHQMLGHPFPPQQGQPLLDPAVVNADGNGERKAAEIPPERGPIRDRVFIGDGGHEVPPGVAHQHLHRADGESQGQQGDEKSARPVPAFRGEEGFGNHPELAGGGFQAFGDLRPFRPFVDRRLPQGRHPKRTRRHGEFYFAGKKVLPGIPRQVRTNYRCSDQGLAGFACRTSTAPDSPERQNQRGGFRNSF